MCFARFLLLLVIWLLIFIFVLFIFIRKKGSWPLELVVSWSIFSIGNPNKFNSKQKMYDRWSPTLSDTKYLVTLSAEWMRIATVYSNRSSSPPTIISGLCSISPRQYNWPHNWDFHGQAEHLYKHPCLIEAFSSCKPTIDSPPYFLIKISAQPLSLTTFSPLFSSLLKRELAADCPVPQWLQLFVNMWMRNAAEFVRENTLASP